MPKTIFLSYAHEDHKYVEKVVAQLRLKGILGGDDSVVLDPERSQVAVVRTRGVAIRQAIESADQVVLLWTEAGEKSQWVNYEAGMADALGKLITVVLVGEASPELPYSLRDVQVIRIT